MANSEADLLWQGFQLCIAAQLVIIGGFKFFSRKQLDIILGVLCLIVASYFFKTIFADIIDKYWLPTLFLSGGLFFYYGPLLFIYIALLANERTAGFYLLHLLPPTVLYFLYGCIRTFNGDFFTAHALTINLAALIICILSISLYFYLGSQIFKRKLDQTLISRPKQKFKFFYFAFNIFLLNQFLSALLVFIGNTNASLLIGFINDYYIAFFAEYLHVPLYVLLSVYLLLYALSQSKRYKSFFLPDRIHLDPSIMAERSAIAGKLQVHFVEEKLFRKPDLRLKDVAAIAEISSQKLTEYLKSEHGLSFSEFVNRYRAQEFMLLVQQKEFDAFNLFGIAQEAGFNSKATFHRAFKKEYGTTPKQAIFTKDAE